MPCFFVSEDYFNMNSTTGQLYSLTSIPDNPPLIGNVGKNTNTITKVVVARPPTEAWFLNIILVFCVLIIYINTVETRQIIHNSITV